MARIEMPSPQAMTAEQAAACAEVIGGKRGKVPTPMIGWLRSPELARRLQKVGELLRFDTSLDPIETELAILVCARNWTSHVEWKAHKALALTAGMAPAIPDAIAARREPVLSSRRMSLVYRLAGALLQDGRVNDALYREGVEALEERGVMEVIGIVGYYTLVSFTLNTFELGLPESAVPELQDPEFPGAPA